jgi:hypothetical protein
VNAEKINQVTFNDEESPVFCTGFNGESSYETEDSSELDSWCFTKQNMR